MLTKTFPRALSVACLCSLFLTANVLGGDPLARQNVLWTTPSKDSSGSMPIGNGDIGLNVWAEDDGQIVFLIGKTDAWSENARLLKLGRVRVRFSPNPLSGAKTFRQELRLREGEIVFQLGEGAGAVAARVWVDANRPVIHLDAESASEFSMEAKLDVWRAAARELKKSEDFSAYGLHGGPDPIIVSPDTVLEGRQDRVVWHHHNARSIWPANLKYQGLESFLEKGTDPLLGRTFGGAIFGEGLAAKNATTLKAAAPRKRFSLRVVPLTAMAKDPAQWTARLEEEIERTSAVAREKALADHRAWWDAFWNRSWIRVGGAPEAETITRGYTLQRWITACGGRGASPIKFNGSIFTVDTPKYDPDYRRWGGPYWWQNTRLPYWPLLASGDFDMMRPMFAMYQATLPLVVERTRVWFGHGGAFFPETMYFWGMYVNENYGWNRGDLPVSELTNRYTRREYTAALELLAMMLDYHAYTRDASFLRETLLPTSDPLLEFWDKHYPRDAKGRLRLYPSQALETYQDAANPTPDVAGLRWVLSHLLELPENEVGAARRAFWARLLAEVPPVPLAGENEEKVILPAGEIFQKPGNSENPELYAVFPFRLYGVGKPNLNVARRSFAKRRFKGHNGWRQDDAQAAYLGLAEEAAQMVATRAANHHEGSRFPAFWGPNFDWIPDQDHGGMLAIALQAMVLQAEEGKLRVLPAWPKHWNVEFKLHAPEQTTVEGVYHGGKFERLRVTPESRAGAVVRPDLE